MPASWSDSQRQGAVQAQLGRGTSQSDINAFLQGNPDDYQRLESAFAPQPGAGSGAGGAAVAGLAAASPPTDSPAAGGGAGVTPSPDGAAAPNVGGGEGGGPVNVFGPGPLRGNLGQRITPQQSASVVGLRKAY